MAIRDLKSVVYTDDLGRDYATKVDASVFAQMNGADPAAPKIGGSDYDGSPELPEFPRNWKKRVALVSIAGSKRRVVCLSPDSTLYTGTDTSINLPVLGAAATAFARYGSNPEKRSIRNDPAQ